MTFRRVEQPCEGVGVPNLGARDIQRVEDVEPADAKLQFGQGIVIDNEALQRLEVRERVNLCHGG